MTVLSTWQKRPHVGVVGAGQCPPSVWEQAEEVGRRLGQAGAVIVCGGLGGVMEAACRGGKSAGALTVGILPTGERLDANPFIDVAIPTGLGEARNALVVRMAEVLIAVGGEYGTLSEIAFALKLGRAVVGLDTWELAKAGRKVEAVLRARSPEDAVQKALGMAAARGG